MTKRLLLVMIVSPICYFVAFFLFVDSLLGVEEQILSYGAPLSSLFFFLFAFTSFRLRFASCIRLFQSFLCVVSPLRLALPFLSCSVVAPLQCLKPRESYCFPQCCQNLTATLIAQSMGAIYSCTRQSFSFFSIVLPQQGFFVLMCRPSRQLPLASGGHFFCDFSLISLFDL